jgi:hypothetical protein
VTPNPAGSPNSIQVAFDAIYGPGGAGGHAIINVAAGVYYNRLVLNPNIVDGILLPGRPRLFLTVSAHIS